MQRGLFVVKINQLPETLANKIAAGEVVERPASVIKELVENSIDAGSTFIKIELKEAGLTEMKVVDDGEGMVAEDCKRAFLRHATSKIKFDADLFHIQSLGFRGEALASIASVSKLTLISSQGNVAGTKLYVEGGEIVQESKADARQGTEITVRELFYNTPARLKYLKSIHTELGHITDLINRYALAHADIRFELFHNEKQVFASTGSGNKLQVISQIYGMQVAKNMLHVETSTLDFEIEGYIAKPEFTRSNRRFITIIVNGRYIKNYAITQAILRGFDTLLPIHRYPIAIIYITLDPILVDVNVHPTKLEVRFSKEKELVTVIEKLIRSAFKQTTLIPKMEHKQIKQVKSEQGSFQLHTPQQPDVDASPFQSSLNDRIIFEQKEEEQTMKSSQQIDHNFFQKQFIPKENINADQERVSEKERIPALYPIGQLQGTYILAQNELGFYMIDQHAAQERVKYEFYKKKLGQPISADQQLLMPLTFEFTLDEIILIEKYERELQEVGIELESFGGQTFAVRSHPTWFPKGMEEEIIRDIISQVIQEGTIKIDKIREEVAILMACKRSIKANHYLTTKDMEHLLEDLRQTEDPFTCPHGRPVIIHYTYYEIEKMFKRIM